MQSFYEEENLKDHLIPDYLKNLSDFEVLKQITELKKELSDELVILGHHYQSNEIMSFADHAGDSLKLSQISASLNKEHIIFCGVHFMAETADILASDNQKVYLPDLNAGCTMADMAVIDQIESAWEKIHSTFGNDTKKVVPITYINCDANLKAFVGKNEGSICTSSNAKKIIEWALSKGDKLFFFPDQHLGRNTCHQLGIKLEEMVIYNPNLENGGLTNEEIKNAKVYLWYGHCSVHQGFTFDHIKYLREHEPNTKIIVHPECNFEVYSNADDSGSTAYIIEKIKEAKDGDTIAIGTEINLVNRLKESFPNINIKSLSPYQCLCTTMYRVRPAWLLHTMNNIKNKTFTNQIKVDQAVKENSLKALNTMLELSK